LEGVNKITNAHYNLDLALYEEVIVENTKWKATDYCVQFSIAKKNHTGVFWPRLTKEKAKFNCVQIDWTRWVDEAYQKNLDYNHADFDDLPDEDSDDHDKEPVNLGDLEDEPDNKEYENDRPEMNNVDRIKEEKKVE